MKLEVTKPDIVSKSEFKRTDIENVFTHKQKKAVAFVENEHALLIQDGHQGRRSDRCQAEQGRLGRWSAIGLTGPSI